MSGLKSSGKVLSQEVDVRSGCVQPNVFLVGAQKSGSTWLASRIGQHPDAFIAPHEIHYYDKKFNYAKGQAWYLAQFEGGRGKKVIGEKTPEYFWPDGMGGEGHLKDVHKLLHSDFPHAKIVVVLRDPVWRAVSALNHMIKSGRFSPLIDFDDYLVGENRVKASPYGIIEKGFYSEFLEKYYSLFPRDQIRTYIFERDIVGTPDLTLRDLCSFLGIDPDYPFTGLQTKENENKKSFARMMMDYYFPPLRAFSYLGDKIFKSKKWRCRQETIEELSNIYRVSNKKLFKLLDFEIEEWL